MSMTDVSLRFAEVLKNHDNYQSVSLPLITDSSEVIFFYYATAVSDGFLFQELGDIAFRDLSTSSITIKHPSELFKPVELAELTDHEAVKTLTGVESYEAVAAYYELHEQVLRRGVDSADESLLGAYFDTFTRIVPKSNLRKVYHKVGQPLFQSLARRPGRQLEL